MKRKLKGLKSLKSQIILFMAAGVLVWFLIVESLNEYMWLQEELGKITVTNGTLTIFVIIQALLFIIINIPFMIFMIKHIDKPVQKIVQGLRKIKSSDFSEKIDFKSNNEFDEIKNEFNKMSEELEKSSKLREEVENQKNLLFANMTHDLKTPITTIQGYSKALLDGIVETSEKQSNYISTIYSKSLLMNDLIDRLFEYVKINSNLNVLNRENVDVAELLRNCLSSVYTEYEERNIELSIEIPEEPVILNIDAVEVKRVFNNILMNVLLHNKPSIKVLVQMDQSGNIIVADSGEKISTAVEENMFQPFVKGDDSRKSGKGSGLGLSLSQKIMEKHGGKLVYLKEFPGYTKAFSIIWHKNSEN